MSRCKIIMYHYVRPILKSSDPKIKGLEFEGFKRQIKFFKKNFRFLTVQALLDCIYDNSEIPKNSIILTFDDGFSDHYSYVFPILKKEGIQGLFFPCARAIDENKVLDVHKIHFILARTKNVKEVVHDIFELINRTKDDCDLDEPEIYFSKLTKADRFDAIEVVFIKQILQRELPLYLRNQFTEILFRKHVKDDELSFAKNFYLTHEKISEMIEGNMFFGAHGYMHDWQSDMNNEELKIELIKTDRFLTKIKKKDHIKIMNYPYGNYNSQVIREIKNLNYKIGLTTKVGDANLNLSNAFTLERWDTNDFPQ